jgi:glycosyltransferase involved in cell wall biosynthesis
MRFSLVSTVFCEINHLDQTISDLKAQTFQPSEIIITDAGSTDGTYERLLQWKAESNIPIIVLQEKGCNIARGRNLAIKAASNDLIVSTDFGNRFHPKWLESLLFPFQSQTNIKKSETLVVGGAYTVNEENLTSIAARANYVLTEGYKLNPETWFIPSSRSIAYTKKVWETIGGYPEWLTLAGDDLVFGMKLKAKGYKWVIADKPYVYWTRHTTSRGYTNESFRYGSGDGEAGVNIRNSEILLIELSLRLLFLFSIASIAFGYLWGIFFLFISCLGFRPYLFAFRNWLKFRSGKYHTGVFMFSLLLLEQCRFAYLKGYFKGFFGSSKNVKAERSKLKAFLKTNEPSI